MSEWHESRSDCQFSDYFSKGRVFSVSRTDDATADAVSARKARRFFPSNDFHTIKCFENQTFGRKKKKRKSKYLYDILCSSAHGSVAAGTRGK